MKHVKTFEMFGTPEEQEEQEMIDKFKETYHFHKLELLETTGLSSHELDDKWSDFISDLIGDVWKYENKEEDQIIQDFIDFIAHHQ